MGLRHVFLFALLAGFGQLYAINVREVAKEKVTVRGDLTAREMAQVQPPPPPPPAVDPCAEFKLQIEAMQQRCAMQDQKIQELTGIIHEQNRTLSDLSNNSQSIKEKVNRYDSENYRLNQTLQQSAACSHQLENELYCWQEWQCEELGCLQAQLYDLQCQLDGLLYQEEEIIDYSYPGYCFPNIPRGCGWQAGGELLVWTVEESELDYAINDVVSPASATGAVGTLESADFGWRPGARAYLDFTTCWDYWNLKLQGTFFYTHGRDSATPEAGTIMQGTFHQVLGSTLAHATSDIQLHYYLVDLLLGRYLQLSERIAARVHVGGIGSWIEQKWNIEYFPAAGDLTNEIDIDWKYRGGGLKIGGALDWILPCNLGIYVEANLATLLGWYQNSHLEEVFDSGVFNDAPFDSRNDQVRFAHTFQIMLGPSWTIRCRCFDLRFYALYEMNLWLGLQEVDRTFISGNPNDGRDSRHVEGILGLHGATIGFQVTF